jgi:chaperonin GroEL
MSKQLLHNEDAQAAMLRGMSIVAEVVGCTLGPRGGTVVLGRPLGFGPAKITKDGVTVAAENSLPDPWENEGAKLTIEVAQRTNQEAGDGTTAATILAHALFKEGIRQVTAGGNPHAIERGIRLAVDAVTAQLKRMATPVEQSDLEALVSVATIAANGDKEIGRVIGEAVHKAGLEGTYSPDTSQDGKNSYQITEGLQFQRGFIAREFMREPQQGRTVFQNCNVFVTDRRMIDGKQMTRFLENYIAKAASVPLLLIAGDVEGTALSILAVNNGRNVVQVVPVRTPGTGESRKEEIEDIAIYTGARYLMASRQDLPEEALMDDFGSADEVRVTPNSVTIIGGQGTGGRIEARKEELRSRIADPNLPDVEKSILERRLAALSSSIVVFKIGSRVNSKLLEKRDRFEDSVRATLAALKEGIVPGGGTALLRCVPELESLGATMGGDEKVGVQIVAHALRAPLWRLATNSGASGDVVVSVVLQSFDLGRLRGYNADTGKYDDLVKAGIVDPAMVVRLSLQNAAELAGLLLTAKAMIVDIPDRAPEGARNPTARG